MSQPFYNGKKRRGKNVMEFVDVLQTLGFPAGVAVFALWNSYKHEQYLQDTLASTIKENTKALTELKSIIARMAKTHRNEEEEEDEV